ncbi:MAG: Flp pilus assembly complex ATPase component TadA [Candidatus Vogelbacteria bacterium]|nr:Flp pilus assembly complex ATPase component TadA [Candidatus Vogelbacteria bacterium]
MSNLSNPNQDAKVEELRRQEAEDLARLLAESKYHLPYADLSTISINTDALKIIKEADARAAGMAGFKLVGKKVFVLVSAPSNPLVPQIIQGIKDKGFVPDLYMGSITSLERAWDRYKEVSYAVETKAGLIGISDEELQIFMDKTKGIDEIKKLIAETTESEKSQGVSAVLEIIIAGALGLKASDIHIEPEEAGDTRLRFRLDGVLHDISFFNKETYKLILSRLKLISGLKLNIKKGAQDGRFSIVTQKKEIEVRTSALPGPYGESIVMRLLDPDSIAIPLESMGMEPRLLEIVSEVIQKPNGMVLITGPTGSGKSTTLYAFLKKVNNPGTKIITIEDPIEYHLAGITQTQVNEDSGYTFMEGLRAALRQDPDIIMVGEIRDTETAKIAINSSLTGHLVFSTLHTNSAAGAIPRMIDLGVNPKVIASALNTMIAQRLVRKLCGACKQEAVPGEKQQKVIASVMASLRSKNIQATDIDVNKIWVAGQGCAECSGLGYKGRIGVFEAILMDAAVEALIDKNPSEREILKAAIPQQLLNMKEDGILKVLKGVTSMDELERVVEVITTEDY